jgi:SAM-dependent methyltransferase
METRKDKPVRHDVINYLIERYGYKKYLEIGVQYMVNWNEIKCETKVGVEPNPLPDERIFRMTSDAFFEQNKDDFDIVFIDGDHTYAQAKKDFLNAAAVLKNGGVIVFHDTNPIDETWTNPYQNGTVYKVIMDIRTDLYFLVVTHNHDHGVCCVFPDNKGDRMDCTGFTFDDFDKNRVRILNLCDWDMFKDMLP